MNVQNAKNLTITEGSVKTIHDKDNRLLWGAVGYDTKYNGDTTQQTYSGKNKFVPQNFTITQEGVTCVLNGPDLTASGKKTNGVDYIFMGQGLELDTVLPAGTYTLSIKAPQNIGIGCNLNYKDVSGALSLRIPAGSTSHTLTSNYQMNKIRVLVYGLETGTTYDAHFEEIQLEFSASPTSYEPFVGGTASPNPDYPQDINVVTGEQTVVVSDGTNSQTFTIDLGSTELAKIGTYQDYIYKSDDDWYVHKETKSIIMSNLSWVDRSWGFSGGTLSDVKSPANNNTAAPLYCSCFVGVTANNCYGLSGSITKGIAISQGSELLARDTDTTVLADFENEVNGQSFYYPLATPTDTKITDSTLIGELNAIHEWLVRYGYYGTVSTSSPNILPLEILQTLLT